MASAAPATSKWRREYDALKARASSAASRKNAEIKELTKANAEREMIADVLVPASGAVAAVVDHYTDPINKDGDYEVPMSLAIGIGTQVAGAIMEEPLARDTGRGMSAGGMYGMTQKLLNRPPKA